MPGDLPPVGGASADQVRERPRDGMALDDGKFIYLPSWRQPGFEMIMTSYFPVDFEEEAILKAVQHFGIGFDAESATAVLVKER